LGDLGITGREAFLYNDVFLPLQKHNLYLIEETNIAWLNHKHLREYLRNNENARDEYSKLKLSLAKKFPNNIDAYIDGKTAFILDILRRSDLKETSLRIIEEQNNL